MFTSIFFTQSNRLESSEVRDEKKISGKTNLTFRPLACWISLWGIVQLRTFFFFWSQSFKYYRNPLDLLFSPSSLSRSHLLTSCQRVLWSIEACRKITLPLIKTWSSNKTGSCLNFPLRKFVIISLRNFSIGTCCSHHTGFCTILPSLVPCSMLQPTSTTCPPSSNGLHGQSTGSFKVSSLLVFGSWAMNAAIKLSAITG